MNPACEPSKVYGPRGKPPRRPSCRSRSNATRPEMSEGRSGRFSHRARFSRPTSTAPVPCEPGTVVLSTNAPTTLPASDCRFRSVARRLSGPRSVTSNDDSTARLRRPPTRPAHSWNAKRSASTWRSSDVGAPPLMTRPSTVNALLGVCTTSFSNERPASPLAMMPDNACIVRSEVPPLHDARAKSSRHSTGT